MNIKDNLGIVSDVNYFNNKYTFNQIVYHKSPIKIEGKLYYIEFTVDLISYNEEEKTYIYRLIITDKSSNYLPAEDYFYFKEDELLPSIPIVKKKKLRL